MNLNEISFLATCQSFPYMENLILSLFLKLSLTICSSRPFKMLTIQHHLKKLLSDIGYKSNNIEMNQFGEAFNPIIRLRIAFDSCD